MNAIPEPMLCALVGTLPEGPEWIYEIKWDGYRALGVVERKKARLISRNQKELPFPDVAAALCQLHCKSAIVDGEIIALEDEGKPSFGLLQHHRSRPPCCICGAF
jgi:bifunctional non-homologous end joining protein LigD